MNQPTEFVQAIATMLVADRFALTAHGERGTTKLLVAGGCMAYPNRAHFPRRQPRRFASLGQAHAYLDSLGDLAPVAPATPVVAAAKKGYTVGKKHYTSRANANEGGVSAFEWVRNTHFSIYPTNLAAKRAYVECWKPEATTWPDQMVKTHFDVVARNEKSVKILSVTA